MTAALDLPAAMRRSAQEIAPGLARDPQPQRERFLQRISPRLRLRCGTCEKARALVQPARGYRS